MNIENVIFSNLIYNEEYSRRVIPFLKNEYFSDKPDRIVYDLIDSYFRKYNKCPTLETLAIDLSNLSTDDDTFKNSKEILETLSDEKTDLNWIVDQTETFCQDKAIYNALMKSVGIINGKNDKSIKETKESIPDILTEALGVSFDNSIGHDFVNDSTQRYEFYNKVEEKISFDIDLLNKITGNGFSKKSLNMLLASTGVGKSMFMCHMAATNLLKGANVLYITLEMAEERIAERIDANLLDVKVNDLVKLSKETYDKKIARMKEKVKGKLIIKEYPTSCAGVGHFRHLLNELKIKRKFIPDIIYIDYINLCISSRLKMGGNNGSYNIVKAIAEELRGLAVENNVAIVSATQTNRGGHKNSDVELDAVSESFGLPATSDFFAALIATDELDQINQILFKQLKNRYSDLNDCKRFVIGVDKSKMRLYNVEQSAQNNIVDDTVNVKYGADKFITDEMEDDLKPKGKYTKRMFENFT